MLKSGKVGKRETKFKFTYSDIANIVDLKKRTVWGHYKKGKFNPHDLKSVVKYVSERLL